MTGISTIKGVPPEPTTTGARPHWFVRFARLFVGSVLVATGIGKALDMRGFAEILATYDLLPNLGNVLVAYTLPFVELGTGLCLLTRLWLRPAAWTAVCLHIMLLSTAIITLGRGFALANCGCFGVFLARPLTGQTVVEDMVMLGMSILVLGASHRWRF